MKSPIFNLLLILIFSFIVALALPNAWHKTVVNNELAQLSEYWADPQHHIDRINKRFDDWMIQSGFFQSLRDHLVNVPVGNSQLDLKVGSPGLMSRTLETFQYVVYETVIRITMLLSWLPFVLLIGIPAIYDAYNSWRINQTNFKMPDSRIFHWSIQTILILSTLMLLIFFIPVTVPPNIIPIYLCVVVLALTLAVSNAQKR